MGSIVNMALVFFWLSLIWMIEPMGSTFQLTGCTNGIINMNINVSSTATVVCSGYQLNDEVSLYLEGNFLTLLHVCQGSTCSPVSSADSDATFGSSNLTLTLTHREGGNVQNETKVFCAVNGTGLTNKCTIRINEPNTPTTTMSPTLAADATTEIMTSLDSTSPSEAAVSEADTSTTSSEEESGEESSQSVTSSTISTPQALMTSVTFVTSSSSLKTSYDTEMIEKTTLSAGNAEERGSSISLVLLIGGSIGVLIIVIIIIVVVVIKRKRRKASQNKHGQLHSSKDEDFEMVANSLYGTAESSRNHPNRLPVSPTPSETPTRLPLHPSVPYYVNHPGKPISDAATAKKTQNNPTQSPSSKPASSGRQKSKFENRLYSNVDGLDSVLENPGKYSTKQPLRDAEDYTLVSIPKIDNSGGVDAKAETELETNGGGVRPTKGQNPIRLIQPYDYAEVHRANERAKERLDPRDGLPKTNPLDQHVGASSGEMLDEYHSLKLSQRQDLGGAAESDPTYNHI